MLSAKRIVEIFRRRGGGEFANLTEKLTADQVLYLAKMAGDTLLVAMMPSKDEWFALTKSHFVLNSGGELHSVPLGAIWAVEISRSYRRELRKFEHIKITGGDLDIDLHDGATLQVKVEPGGPYFGLMNVLMRIATINRRRKMRETPGNLDRPTADDQRPATLP
jgi:hypothetical protein